jgi:hypothetical protein
MSGEQARRGVKESRTGDERNGVEETRRPRSRRDTGGEGNVRTRKISWTFAIRLKRIRTSTRTPSDFSQTQKLTKRTTNEGGQGQL